MHLPLSRFATISTFLFVSGGSAIASGTEPNQVDDTVLTAQREMLATITAGAGYGPQSPRDIDAIEGNNQRAFEASPESAIMNLCNIHFHENAEHKGGDFTTFAGNGDGHGFGTGFKYNGTLTTAELARYDHSVGRSDHGDLEPGDTIEVHYVYSSAKVKPGVTLNACFNKAIINPQLRVDAQVYVLVNDDSALDFIELTHHEEVNGFHQATNIPGNTGIPVLYAGSTTGPGFNESGSPFQVSWSVRPLVAKVSISSVDKWLQGNVFEEDHAHGVRNLVVNPALLSQID